VTDRDLPGAELARGFFAGVVEPLLSKAVPGLGYAAARLGSGSDVLGLDDEMSRDHDWGCRLTLLVDEDARDQVPRISRMLEESLPERFGEFPVRFPVTWDSSVSHKVEVATVADFAASRLGVPVDRAGGLSVLDWLSVTGQSVLEVTAGPVFTDRTRTLASVRTMLAWYPPDVERYVLAAGWQRLCQLLPMVGRTAETGDEFGSRLLSAGLAGDVVWLAFALSRRWAPYAKWRGTVFRSLPVADRLGSLLDAVAAPGWRERENALAAACEVLLDSQRKQGQPAPRSAVIPVFDRPYRTVDQAVPQGLLAGITDPDVARLPPLVGSIEQWVDGTDVLSSPGRRAALQAAYRAWAAQDEALPGRAPVVGFLHGRTRGCGRGDRDLARRPAPRRLHRILPGEDQHRRRGPLPAAVGLVRSRRVRQPARRRGLPAVPAPADAQPSARLAGTPAAPAGTIRRGARGRRRP
jgi:Domain of unknown function (DUF4037)